MVFQGLNILIFNQILYRPNHSLIHFLKLINNYQKIIFLLTYHNFLIFNQYF